MFREPGAPEKPAKAATPFGWRKHLLRSRGWFIFAVIGMIFLAASLFLALFEPALEYKIQFRGTHDNTSDQFLRTLSALTNAELTPSSSAEVFTNGESFYEAELAAIRSAQKSVNLEAYIFEEGEVTRRFLEALTERARAGVKVNLIIDAIGALSTKASYFAGLREAGGQVAWYHPLRWYTWHRLNNRTHRELIIVDGRLAFTGGAGFADHWRFPKKDSPRWRDSMVRIEGESVSHLQSTFAENWVEASGDILFGQEYFPFLPSSGSVATLVVDSTPSAGRSTRARMLFQTLLASARKSIHITTPYFLPDESASEELVRARRRGVDVKIIVPGKKIDHQLTRRSSRRLFGPVLEAGGRIYEYQPSMIHTKSMIVDGLWSVMGTTNFDPRSFNLNDEVNVVFRDAAVAWRVERDFQLDLTQSREITFEQWKKRPIWEHVEESFGGLLQRQQ